METKPSLLIVEDDDSLRQAVHVYLRKKTEFEIQVVPNIEEAKKALLNQHFNLILSDVKMPGGSGFDLLKYVKEKNLNTMFILITAYGTIEDAVDAMRQGAYDFIAKPFSMEKLIHVLKSALKDQIAILPVQKMTSDDDQFGEGEKSFITKSPKILELIKNLKKVANSKATVLIQGESGTGKEVLAHMIHHYSPRRDKAFVAINCAALPDNLLENELFGHEKGSFTGAIQRQIGKFEISDSGTILLDEISEMSINMQTKLLRVLQEGEVYRIGGNKPIPLNLRVIASTNRDLYQHMKNGFFREDLYYRIHVIPIFVPPLRERGQDLFLVAEHFLKEFSRVHGRPSLELNELARHKIMSHPWQGNVRELRNAMERAILVGNFDQIGVSDATTEITSILETLVKNPSNSQVSPQSPSDTISEDMTLGEIEKRVIFETLHRCGGNRTRTAEKLGISLRTLRNKLKAFKAQEQEMLNS